MTSTDKMIEILTKLKTLGLTDEQLNEVGEAFGTAQGMLQREIVAPLLGPANATTVTAFGAAAVPLLTLSEDMRRRVLDALSVLLLPRTPSFLEELAPTLAPILEAALAQGRDQGQADAVPQADRQDVPFRWVDDTNPMTANAVRIVHALALEGVFTAAGLADYVGLDVSAILSDDQDKLPPVYRDE